MLDWLTDEVWLAWGVGLLIGFPLLTILFGEMLHRIESSDSDRESRSSLGSTLYFVLPSLVIYLLLIKVLELDHSSSWVRITATIFWISIIYLCLSAFNFFWLSKSVDDTSWQSRIPSLVLNIARLFFVLFGVAFVMSIVWGIDLGKMLAALGVGSIVLGLALQDTLGGLFAGITLISARQFKIGDWIKTGDVTGKVITVNWYSTSLQTFEMDLLVIPNSVLASDTFNNFSQPTPIHMERIVIQFWEEQPPNKVREALLEAAYAAPGILDDPAPEVLLIEYGDDAGSYEAHIYFEDYADIDQIRDAYLTHAWYAAKRHNIVFPYEDLQLYHFQGDELDIGSSEAIEPGQLVDKLEQLQAFNLSREELELLSTDAILYRFGRRETILKEGQESDGLFVVLSGVTRKVVPGNNGIKYNAGMAQAGEMFGAISAIRSSESLITVYAETDTEIAKISTEKLREVLKSNPVFAQEMEKDIETRLENLNAIRQKGEGSFKKAESKVVTLRGLLKGK